jgi:hypothetical protein
MLAANNLSELTNISAARTNLGLTIGTNVPSPTGGGASGTWGISISGNAATVSDNSVSTAKIINGNVTADKIGTAAVTAAKLSGVQSGSAPIYGARAWVNFNGTGTVAIRASGNVSSITDNSTGDYTLNFTTAMPDASYSLVGTSIAYDTSQTGNSVAISGTNTGSPTTMTTSAVRILTGWGGFLRDLSTICVSIHR